MAAPSFMPMLVPGIDRSLTKADLKLASITATGLPRIHRDMKAPVPHLEVLVTIIENHNMVDKMAVHLLHSHEQLKESEIKLEKKLETAPGTWMQPVSADSIDPADLHTLAFKVDHTDSEDAPFSLIPYEFGEGQSPIMGDERVLECMSDLATYIVEKDLVDIFALQLVQSDDHFAGPTAELEVEGFGTITLPQSMQKIEALIPVSWPTCVSGSASQLSGPPPGQHWNVSTKPDGTQTHKVHVDNAESEEDILKGLTDQAKPTLKKTHDLYWCCQVRSCQILSSGIHPEMDVTKYAAGPESYDILSDFQISNFFANTSITKTECDDVGATLLGGPVSATPIQGGSSYTVERMNVPKVVQFRSLQLDMAKLRLAQQVYTKFVPQCAYHDILKPLHVYVWDRVPGTAFCRVRREMFASDMNKSQGLSQTVDDFARFFALAWINRPAALEPSSPGLQDSYIAILNGLSLTLPESLHSTIDAVRKDLHLLFRPEYPTALQHGDILENNIHVDEETGHITGVLDWPDAFVAPFGLSLGGAEILLGIQTNQDWHFHPFHVELRQQFWKRLNMEIGEVSELDRQAMKVARLMGLFQLYGFEQNGMSGVYLEKLILL
ncbi:unnamed protein product [Fusarium langsethiae]|nr:unnamed protein product [Fusarium langsethiae]